MKQTTWTPGQIECTLHAIKDLREVRLFSLADHLRDELVTVGYYWYMPRIVNLGNLNGHLEKQLRFYIKDGEHHLEGFIIEMNWSRFNFHYVA